jgi:dihydrofolate reductase
MFIDNSFECFEEQYFNKTINKQKTKMRKVILLMHVSLDGFVAGPNGEMDWINMDEELWGPVTKLTDEADAALFGRVTYQMMENYWPTAAKNPGATKHDIDHSNWVNNVHKIVFSKTLQTTTWNNSRIVSGKIAKEINELKQQQGKNLLMIGSVGMAQTFMQLGLIDEYFINVNPVVLGSGRSLFKDIMGKFKLTLIEAKQFKSGVVGLHYKTMQG